MSSIDRAAALLADRVDGRLRRNEPLAPMTTYKVGGDAALFLEATSIDDLLAIADVRAATGIDVLVVGRGSNMLVADDGFDGVAVSIAGFADSIEIAEPEPDSQRVVVTAGGAVALPVLARRTAAAAVTGFEWAVGVPGSIGGAVRMNAGGHGSDMASCLIDVDIVDLASPAAPIRLELAELGLSFRASQLTEQQIVVSARLALAPGSRSESEAAIGEIVRWRRQHQPGGQNCGSVFVNPVPGEVTAGELVDRLGLRGLRIGTAWVSEKHANFIQAADGGRAADVRAVIETVRRRVADATGYVLRSEVRMVGFDDVTSALAAVDDTGARSDDARLVAAPEERR